MLGVRSASPPPVHARRYPAPLSSQRALSIAEALALEADASVLDVACGGGGLLLDTLALTGGSGVGLARSARDCATARANAAREALDARADFRVATPDEFRAANRFDAILCIGALADFGATEHAAARFHDWLRPTGRVVVGEPFLRRTPPPSYADLLGAAMHELQPRGTHARTIVNAGFELVSTAVCGESEWDAYESATYRASVRHAELHPDDPEALVLRDRAEAWYHAYWHHGRDTLGYALHVFRRPRATLRAV